MEIQIEKYLLQFVDSKIKYIPNPGNAGDNIIAAATLQRFHQLNIDFEIVNRHSISLHDEIVFYGGGGNLGKMTNFSAQCLKRIHKSVRRLVILPHTIDDVTHLLLEFDERVDIICRERYSYDYVKSVSTKANVYLAGDMAFGLDIEKVLKFEYSWSDIFKGVSTYILSKSGLTKKQAPTLLGVKKLIFEKEKFKNFTPASSNVLNAFRTDGEKTAVKLPIDNIDISEEFALGAETDLTIHEGARRFLEFVSRFDIVNTNRLHVAISAALLGKKVNFHPNNYFKCKAVYEYSMTTFDNVKWVSDNA